MMNIRRSGAAKRAASAGLVLLTSLAASPRSVQAATVSYTIIDLGTFGGSASQGLGINNAGQVVGWARTAAGAGDGPAHAFVWQGGALKDLDPNGASSTSSASAISPSGVVVGKATFGTTAHAVRWQNDVMTDLGTLPGTTSSSATAINPSGQVVGSSGSTGFLFDGATMTDLGHLPNECCSAATGISDGGLVVGAATVANGASHRAFMWQQPGPMVDLGLPPGVPETADIGATGVNASGQVLVSSPPFIANPAPSFVYQSGTWTALPSVIEATTAINNVGQVLGNNFSLADGSTPYLVSGGVATPVSDLLPAGSGWGIRDVNGINDSGQIVGTGFHLGKQHAFVLSPANVPPPPPPPAPAVKLSPASLSFADQRAGSASSPQTVTVTNTGNAALTVTGVNLSGSHPSDFALTADTCTGASVAAQGSCSVDLTFRPHAVCSVDTATLTVADNAADSPQSVALAGRGVVASPAAVGTITEYCVADSSHPSDITAGPDGNVWFTEEGSRFAAPKIGRMGRDGSLTEFATSAPLPVGPFGITAGPDGNLWFAEGSPVLDRITPDGTVTAFPLPGGHWGGPMTTGPDGRLWFTGLSSCDLSGSDVAGGRLSTIAPNGRVTEYPPSRDFLLRVSGTSGSLACLQPTDIAAGPDGNLWFTSSIGGGGTPGIGKMTPQGGYLALYPVPSANPRHIIAGPGNELWFIDEQSSQHQIGKITTDGVVTMYPQTTGLVSEGMARAADGNVYFTGTLNASSVTIGRMTPDGMVSQITAPSADNPGPWAITAGPDQNLWFTERGGGQARVARLDIAATAARAFVQPQIVAFGAPGSGQTTPARTVTVTSTGTAPLTISNVRLAGPDAKDFQITTSTCTGPVAPAASCTIGVAFTERAKAGTRHARLEVVDDAAFSPQAVRLLGGNEAVVALAPGQLSFADQAVGSPSPSKRVTVTNIGGADLVIKNVAISSAEFTISASTCSGVVSPGAACAIDVSFRPTDVGGKQAELTLSDNARQSRQRIPLSGNGVAAAGLTVDRRQLAFGDQKADVVSKAARIMVSNTSTTPLTITQVHLAGLNPPDFSISADTCTGRRLTNSANDRCSVSVTFTPKALGKRAAALNIAADAAGLGSPQQVQLLGNATPVAGGYVDPAAGVAAAVEADGYSPHRVYRLTAAQVGGPGGPIELTITPAKSNKTALKIQVPANAAWGFSPDDDRLVYHYTTPQSNVDNVVLWDVAAARQVWTTAVATQSDRILFSPHGRYLSFQALTGPNHSTLSIVDTAAVSAPLAYQSEINFVSVPGQGEDQFGTEAVGFSPDGSDATFALASVFDQSTVSWNVVNLASDRASGATSAAVQSFMTRKSGFWRFSPCGGVIALVTQGDQTNVEVQLFRTDQSAPAVADQSFGVAEVKLRTDAATRTTVAHVANVGGTDRTLATLNVC